MMKKLISTLQVCLNSISCIASFCLFFESTVNTSKVGDIGSIYDALADCLWSGGRVIFRDNNPSGVLALMREYGGPAQLTFSNSPL